MHQSIATWHEDDRPREKLIKKGKAALSDAELLAILIGSGTTNLSAVDLCKNILNDHQNQLHLVARMTIKQLINYKGIGEAKALSIIAALELGKRIRAEQAEQIPKITCSRDVYNIMEPLIGDLYQEEFWVLYLNASNRVIHKELICKGGINSTLVDNRIVFKGAFEHHAISIILCHNHPSGKLEPSESDKKLTQKIKNAAALLDIHLYDHLIITQQNYYSFADKDQL